VIDADLILGELKKIIGLPLRYVGRACDVIWFGFGNLIKKEDKRCGGFREVAEYDLHVQCAFRLTDSEKIIVGSADKYIPSSEIEDYNDFDWDVQGANRCDEQLKEMFSKITTGILVKNITADRFGGIKVFLSEDILLEIIPDNSTEDEAWRFFSSGAGNEHFVISGIGIDWE
jgi:hypothetical protein